MIDDTLINYYIHCPHKAYLFLNYPQEYKESSFDKLEIIIKENIWLKYTQKNLKNNTKFTDFQTLSTSFINKLLTNFIYKNDEYYLNFSDVLQRENIIIFYDISAFENPTKEEKLIAGLKAYIIETQRKETKVEVYFVKYDSLKINKLKITSISGNFKEILISLKELKNNKTITRPSIKPHCQICQFQAHCKRIRLWT